MNFIDFKKILKKNNIKLFDHEYRILYHRVNKLNNIEEILLENNINNKFD